MINEETWVGLDIDIKGTIYEGLLQKNAEDVKGGAGQYFTPRPLISAIVDVIRPKPMETIGDPACGTGGFFLKAHEFIETNYNLDRDQKKFLKESAFKGWDIVPEVVRLCAMNLYLHGIGSIESPIINTDALISDPGDRFDIIMTNPPFGKKSSMTSITEEGKAERETLFYERDDFWVSTSNKQLNFLQHVKTILKVNGRAAMVVPDNVLFEGGAGETVRRRLLKQFDVHTLLRLPTGIFYAGGVKANVLFFDKHSARPDQPWTSTLWVYDFRGDQHFTLKQNRLQRHHLDDFVACYRPGEPRDRREPTDRFRPFSYEELAARDKANLDITLVRDPSLDDTENLLSPEVIAREIVEDLEAALSEFAVIAETLQRARQTGDQRSGD